MLRSRNGPSRSAFPLPRVVVMLAALAILGFLFATPDGLLTKANMIGYAVCHRMASHSFCIGGHQLPLCARCSGTFLGVLIGFFGQVLVLRSRGVEFPPPRISVVLVGFTLLWAADGLNSYLSLLGAPQLYAPHNWLRLTTGALNGLTMSAFVYPVFNFTLWRQPVAGRAIRSLSDLAVLLLLEAVMVGAVLSRRPFLLYPLALLSALAVLTVLTSVNTTLLMTILRRENVVGNWLEAAVPLLGGLTLSLVQIGLIDVVRYSLTGTLSGLPSPG